MLYLFVVFHKLVRTTLQDVQAEGVIIVYWFFLYRKQIWLFNLVMIHQSDFYFCIKIHLIRCILFRWKDVLITFIYEIIVLNKILRLFIIQSLRHLLISLTQLLLFKLLNYLGDSLKTSNGLLRWLQQCSDI